MSGQVDHLMLTLRHVPQILGRAGSARLQNRKTAEGCPSAHSATKAGVASERSLFCIGMGR